MAGTILVGYDGSPAAKRALDWALRLAEGVGHDVDVLFVADTSWDSEDFSAAPLLNRQGEVMLSAVAFHADSKAPHVAVTPRMLPGDPVHVLCEQAASTGAEMLVVGSYRKDLYERITTSAVSTRVAAAATVPVVVVPDVDHPRRSGVVVGIDGGESSVSVLTRVLGEAERIGEHVTVVTAWSLPPMNQLDYTENADLTDAFEARARGVVADALTRVEQERPGLIERVGVSTSVVFDSPTGALLAAARDAELLVVGSHGRRGLSRFLLGSVSHDVIVHTSTPVLVLRVKD